MANVILFLAMVVPLFLVVACLFIWRLWLRRDKRRSPLNLKVINLPGEQARKQMIKHDETALEAMALVVALGPIFLAAWALGRLSRVIPDWTQVRFGAGDLLLLVVMLMMLVWSVWRVIRHTGFRRRYREGLEAELSVAQCLMPLMADGAVVYHDFPADKFNIDHIVIGRCAVFAVETKSRKKPGDGGRDSARVAYDGSKLAFPNHFETLPVEQARRQAEWLARFLASGVGDPVRVVPVLALPGWFVESNTSRADVLVSNCRNSGFMLTDKFGPVLTEAMRKRIAHVLMERYPPIDL